MPVSLRLREAARWRWTWALGLALPGLGAAAAVLWWPAIGHSGGQQAFFDDLERQDAERWERSHGWSNGDWVGCSWRAENVVFSGGTMKLVIDDKGGRDHALACAEYRTHTTYHYGRYEVALRAARGSGVVSAFFVYTGPPFGDPWHETTIEILGKDTTKVQFTVFVGDDTWPVTLDLGFDAAADFHTYAIDWAPDAVRWYVDGELRHVHAGADQPLPKKPGRIYADVWAVGDGLEDWLGPFAYPGEPVTAAYDWVRFTPRRSEG